MMITDPATVMITDINDFDLPIQLKMQHKDYYELYYMGEYITAGTPRELQRAVRLAAAIYDKMGWRF